MYLVPVTNTGHPKLQAWKYPLPGDKVVTMIQRVVIDVDFAQGGAAARCRPTSTARRCATTSTAAAATGTTWSGARTMRTWPLSPPRAITSRRRLRVADAATGDVRDVFDEKVADVLRDRATAGNWHYLPASQRSHLVLASATTGAISISTICHRQAEEPDHARAKATSPRCCSVDEKTRQIYFVGVGREKGRDPYFRHSLPRRLRRQEPDAADAGRRRPRHHAVARRAATSSTSYSTPDVPPVAVLRDATGKLVMPLEKADISKLAGDRLEAARCRSR